MRRCFIVVNNRTLDLYPDTIVAITKQFLDLRASNRRRVSMSTGFTIPQTPNNVIAFGFPALEASTSYLPYNIGGCKVIINGIEIFTNALIVVNKVDGKKIDLVIYDQVIQFFDALSAMKAVNEYDFGYYLYFNDDNSTLLSNRLNTEGIVTPVINHGRMYPFQRGTMQNSSFDGQLSPWENEDNGFQDWAYNGANNDVRVTLNASNSSTETSENLVNDTYKLFSTFKYKFQLELEVINVSGGAFTVDVVVVHGAINGDEFEQVNYTTAGTKTFVFEVHANQDSDAVKIYAVNNSAGAHNATIALKNLFITPSAVVDVKFPYYLPSLYYHSIVKKVIEEAGYEWEFQFNEEQQNYFESLVINHGNSSYPDSFRKARSIVAESAGQTINVILSSQYKFLFTNVRKTDDFGFYDASAGTYSPGSPGYTYRTNDRAYVRFDIVISGGGTFRVALNNNASIFGETYVDIDTSGTYAITIKTDDPTVFDTGPNQYGSGESQYLYVQRIAGFGSTASITVIEGTLEIDVREDYALAPTHLTAFSLPSVSCRDFIKDFIIRFGLLFKQENNKIIFKPIQNIVSERVTAHDWTQKRNAGAGSIEFTSEYGQKNYFRDSTAEETYIEDTYLEINNPGLKTTFDYYTSFFTKTRDYSINGLQIASPIFFDEESQGVNRQTVINPIYKIPTTTANSGVRLIKLRRELATDPEVFYGGSLQTTYFIGTYADWSDFLEMFYPWLSDAFDRYKLIERFYMLNVMDVLEVDDFNLIYDNQNYYLPDKIQNFIEGKLTKVTLLKV